MMKCLQGPLIILCFSLGYFLYSSLGKKLLIFLFKVFTNLHFLFEQDHFQVFYL